MQFDLYSVNNKFISSWQGALFGKVDCREGGWDGRSMKFEIMFRFIIKKNSVIVPIISAVGRIWKGLIWMHSIESTKSTLTSRRKLFRIFFFNYWEIIIPILLHLFLSCAGSCGKRIREGEKTMLSTSRYCVTRKWWSAPPSKIFRRKIKVTYL